jgi:lysocardiolipin and lysophospholipid acyltransferase
MRRKGKYAPDYFTLRSTYFQGRPPKSVNMYWRRFAVADIPVGDTAAFDDWILKRWKEKDELLETFYNTGRFPSDETASKESGYIETEVKLKTPLEILAIFAPLGAFAMVANVFAKLWEMFAKNRTLHGTHGRITVRS